ncbi:MAG TPA: hypothetical protein VIL00_12705 [Pseudonocardiaceae bacterium]
MINFCSGDVNVKGVRAVDDALEDALAEVIGEEAADLVDDALELLTGEDD